MLFRSETLVRNDNRMEKNLNGKRILVESGGGVGDLIMFTPALRSLKEKFPGCMITFLTIDKTVDVINRLPYIDRVICIKRGRFMGRYRVLPDLIKQDYLIFTEWQPYLLFCAWILRCSHRFSVGRDGKFLTGTLHKRIRHVVSSSVNFAAQTNAELLSDMLDVKLNGDMTKCDVSMPTESERTEVTRLLNKIGIKTGNDFILLSPFASSKERNWPLKEVEKLVELINKNYNIPVIFIGNTDSPFIEKKFQYSLLRKTNIIQLIEVIRRAKCLITPDSGPMHIAGALNVPCISLFSKDVPSRWAPKHNCWPIYLSYPCSPCTPEKFRDCPYDLKCMKDITANMVFKVLSNILPLK